jgi:hypothetical protein
MLEMYFDGQFRHIGTIDPQPLARAIESLSEDAWHEFVRRQEKFEPHRQTLTIPLIFDEDMRHSDPTAWPRMAEMESVLKPAMDKIRQIHAPVDGASEGYFIRIILTRLSPGSFITPHRDYGASILRSHRYHLPISTTRLVDFAIDGQFQHFAAGEIWEINNRKYHAVRNLGQDPRVHLILDYVVPGEQIHDPDEGLVVA